MHSNNTQRGLASPAGADRTADVIDFSAYAQRRRAQASAVGVHADTIEMPAIKTDIAPKGN